MRAILMVLALALGAGTAGAADLKSYVATADSSLRELDKGAAADLAAVARLQEKMLKIGIAACQEFGAKNAEVAPLLAFVVKSVPAMRKMTLPEIEKAWHGGMALVDAGFENAMEDHFGVVSSLVELVIHPATALIALGAYGKAPSPELMKQMRKEIEEVKEHAAML